MTTTDLAPRPPVTVRGVLDDPELAWRLCETNAPYPHVLMQREFAASLGAYREAARNGSPDAVGVRSPRPSKSGRSVGAVTPPPAAVSTANGLRQVLRQRRCLDPGTQLLRQCRDLGEIPRIDAVDQRPQGRLLLRARAGEASSAAAQKRLIMPTTKAGFRSSTARP